MSAPRRRWAIALAGLVFVAAVLRLWRLGEIPFGFHSDEGHNALDALAILKGDRPVFLPGNNGREPLFHYLMAAAMGFTEPTIRGARLAAAWSGIVYLPLHAWFVASLPIARARRVALLSAALYAVTLWPVHQARYALRAVLLPLWVVLLLWAWWQAVEGRSKRPLPLPDRRLEAASRPPRAKPNTPGTRYALAWAALAGLAAGAAVHTHITGRVLLAIPLVSALWCAGRTRSARPLVALAVTVTVAVAVAWPQIAYFRANPDMLTYRAAQVSVTNPDVSGGRPAAFLAGNAARLAAMPVLRGDEQWYHNVKRRPVFPGVMAAAFILGLFVLARQLLRRGDPRRGHAAVLLIVAAAVTSAPSLLSGAAPNYIRLTGAWPWLLLLPAVGLDAFARALTAMGARAAGGRADARRVGRVVAAAGTGLIVGGFALTTVRDYFGHYAQREEVYRVFNALAVERGYQVAAALDDGPTVVSELLWMQSVIRFVNASAAPQPAVADVSTGLLVPAVAGEGRIDRAQVQTVQYLFDPLDEEAAAAFARRWPQAGHRVLDNGGGGRSLDIFRLPLAAIPGPEIRSDAMFGGAIQLDGITWEGPSAPSRDDPAVGTLVVHLRALAPTTRDHNVFVRVLDATGAQLASWDGPPLGGSHPTDRWVPGERILQRVELPISRDDDEGETESASDTVGAGTPLQLHIGVYDWRDGMRLSVPGSAEDAVEMQLDGR